MDHDAIQKAINARDCDALVDYQDLEILCRHLADVTTDLDDVKTQVYIIAGVGGGILLILTVLVIALFVKFQNGFNALYDGDVLAKRGFSTYTGRPVAEPVPYTQPTFTVPSPPPFKPAAHDATAGGVRVLPRNPPIRNGQSNKGYY